MGQYALFEQKLEGHLEERMRWFDLEVFSSRRIAVYAVFKSHSSSSPIERAERVDCGSFSRPTEESSTSRSLRRGVLASRSCEDSSFESFSWTVSATWPEPPTSSTLEPFDDGGDAHRCVESHAIDVGRDDPSIDARAFVERIAGATLGQPHAPCGDRTPTINGTTPNTRS